METRKVVKGIPAVLIAASVFSNQLYVVAAYSQQVGQLAQSSGKANDASKEREEKMSTESLKYDNEGKVSLQNGDYKAALKMFERAIEIDPDNLSAYISAANCCINTGDFNKAKKYAEESVKLSSDSSYARFNLAVANDNLKEYESAKKNYQMALSGCVIQGCGDDIINVIKRRLEELK